MTTSTPSGGDPAGLLLIEQIRDERGVALQLRGELDLSSAPELKRRLADIAGASPGRLLIDLSELEFMDSSGLALIIQAEHTARANGHQLRLAPGPPQVQRLLELTRTLDFFTFED
ncbi:MAG: STAS domain-containing protein [Solirubrobacteraceae bacterium]